MKHMKFTLKASLLGKLLLAAAMMIGGGSSVWGQKALPYEYGFENNDLAGEGWTISVGGSTAIYSLNSSYIRTGSYDFRFLGSTDAQYLISPELTNSATGVDVSFYYNSFTSASSRTFNVGYSTTNTELSSFTWLTNDITYQADGWFQFNESFPTGTKYIAIRHNAISQYQPFYIDDFAVTVSTAYKTPTSFSLDSFTGTSASFSWTAGGSEEAWELSYSGNVDFTPGSAEEGVTTISISNNPYILSNLTTGNTYYAAIRANYGGGNYSDWTEKIAFTPLDEVVLSLYDGSSSSFNIPISSANVDNSTALTQTQFIVPAADLNTIRNRQIIEIMFYASRSSLTWGAATFEVYMKETDRTSYSTSTKEFESWGTCVYNNKGLSTNSGGIMVIHLNTPFNYEGGNLMIGLKQKTKGTKPSSTYWYSTANYSNNAIYSYGTTTVVTSYSPKVTITSIPVTTAPVKLDDNGYTTFASPWALDLTSMPSGLTAYRAKVFEEESKVRFYSDINQEVAANTGVLLAGSPGKTYMIPVAASGTTLADNDFLVNEAGGTFEAGDYTYYGMLKNSTPLAFGEFNPETVAIPSNKAYVKVTKAAAAKGFSFVFEDTATAIRTLSEAQPAAGKEVFDLSGRKVMNSSLKKGLYIIGGKKMLVK